MPAEPIRKAARILNAGGVVAYPTEGVFGLGCLPEAFDAVVRIIRMKNRKPGTGLILIAAYPEQLDPWVQMGNRASRLTSSVEKPITWVVPASADTPYWITGEHEGVAVRITAHPVAAALCDAAGSAIVSTSANLAGHPPARNHWVLRRRFRRLVDYVVPGRCGPARGPSEIRVLETGDIIRAAGQ